MSKIYGYKMLAGIKGTVLNMPPTVIKGIVAFYVMT